MSMVPYSRFKPIYGSNQVVTTGAVSASIPVDPQAKVLRICNTGTILAYIKSGQRAITATSADMPINAGDSIVIHKAYGDDRVAYIHPGIVATSLHIQLGDGD